jgi:hypothetical protein
MHKTISATHREPPHPATITFGCDLTRVEFIDVCCIHLKLLKDYWSMIIFLRC